MGGTGKQQLLTPLSPGSKVYVTVRAHTGVGNILEASTDGVVPDISSPSLSLQSVQGYELPTPMESSVPRPLYVRSADPYTAAWDVGDMESLVAGTSVSLGSVPEGNDILSGINTSNFTALPNNLIRSTAGEGTPQILSLTAWNNVRDMYIYYASII